ncbi:MAG TPA: glycosyltransferase family 4 protein [Coleofasciculaceae cyanobacterium]
MKILMLSATFPYPPTRGGTQVRTFNLLKYLQQRHSVTVLTLRSPDVSDDEVAALRQSVTELAIFPRLQTSDAADRWMGKLQRFGSFMLGGKPPSVWSSYSPQAQGWVEQAVEAGKFEVVTCEHCVNEIYVRPQWKSRLHTVVNIHSSVYGTCKNQLETGTSEHIWRDRLNLPLLYRYERQYCEKFSGIVVTTDEDRQQIQAFAPAAEIAVIPNGVDFEQFPYRSADPGGHRLVFVGAMDNAPNIDAVRFFSLEVFPAIRQTYPDATLELVGSRPGQNVTELGDRPGITVTGRVPSMVDYLHRATVCVVPMRTGFGIKNKTLEAMAAGTPVVGSDRGLEGLAVDAANLPLRALRANRVAEYVSAIERLFEQPGLRAQLSQAGRLLVEQDYTWERAGQRYEQVLSRTVEEGQ